VETYNDDSIRKNKEYGASVYEKDGGYTYTVPSTGSSWTVKPSVEPTQRTVADLHTHGADERSLNKDRFSDEDIILADTRGIPSYVGLPSGTMDKYDPATGEITSVSLPNKETPQNGKDDPTISGIQNFIDNIEHDINYPDQARRGSNMAPNSSEGEKGK